MLPQRARRRQSHHVAISCQVPPACVYCARQHSSRKCEVRVVTILSVLCPVRDRELSTKFRGRFFFPDPMRFNREKPSKYKPIAPLCYYPDNSGGTPAPSLHPAKYHPQNSLHQLVSVMSAKSGWTRHLPFSV